MSWILPPADLLSEGDARAPLTAALGHSPDGKPLALDIATLPHLAIAGTSGSGKSTLIRTILSSLLMVSDPDDLRLVLVDVTDELEDLRGIPHLAEEPIDEVEVAANVFEALVDEMDDRYETLRENDVRNVTEYNALGEERMPRILCVVDEFAELMLSDEKKRIERAVSRLGIRGRKTGIHLMIATQIPHAIVLTPKIKANMAGRIALALPSVTFSRVALDEKGAEKLVGKGDALLRDGHSLGLQRFQGSYVSRDELRQVVEHWKDQVVEPPESLLDWDDGEDDDEFVVRRRWSPWGFVAGVAVFVALAFIPTIGLPGSSPSCPSGTSIANNVLSETCDHPNGRTACAKWVTGFTPIRADQSETVTYEPDAVRDVGRWCPGASSPPPGLG